MKGVRQSVFFAVASSFYFTACAAQKERCTAQKEDTFAPKAAAIAERIRRLKFSRPMSQAEITRALGISMASLRCGTGRGVWWSWLLSDGYEYQLQEAVAGPILPIQPGPEFHVYEVKYRAVGLYHSGKLVAYSGMPNRLPEKNAAAGNLH